MSAAPTIVGIDVAAKRPCVAVALRPGRHGCTVQDDDWFPTRDAGQLVEWVVGLDPLVVAIDAPQAFNRHLPKSAGGVPKPPKSRVCDWELRRRGIHLYQVPGRDEWAGWPAAQKAWMAVGFDLFDRLRRHGFERPTTPGMPGSLGAARAVLEVYPHASFAALLGRMPASKTTRAGVKERIQLLRQHGIDWDFYFDHDSLDALAAALTGWRYVQGLACGLGAEREGLLWMPVPELAEGRLPSA